MEYPNRLGSCNQRSLVGYGVHTLEYSGVLTLERSPLNSLVPIAVSTAALYGVMENYSVVRVASYGGKRCQHGNSTSPATIIICTEYSYGVLIIAWKKGIYAWLYSYEPHHTRQKDCADARRRRPLCTIAPAINSA